jgi:hypothetical protein
VQILSSEHEPTTFLFPSFIPLTQVLVLSYQTLICRRHEFGFEMVQVHPALSDSSIIRSGDIIVFVENQRLSESDITSYMNLSIDLRCDVVRFNSNMLSA